MHSKIMTRLSVKSSHKHLFVISLGWKYILASLIFTGCTIYFAQKQRLLQIMKCTNVVYQYIKSFNILEDLVLPPRILPNLEGFRN